MSTALVLLVVAAMIVLSVRRYLKMRKEGCSGCGSCPYSKNCNKKK